MNHKHNWLLQFIWPKSMYADNFKVKDADYFYQCQDKECGEWYIDLITNLDNAPTPIAPEVEE